MIIYNAQQKVGEEEVKGREKDEKLFDFTGR